MIEVSERAVEEIKRFLEGREGTRSIRILMTEGDWKGPRLVMALDGQRDNDHVFTDKGVTLLVEKELFDRVKPISIDYVRSAMGSGYTLKSDLFKEAGAGCDCISESCEGPNS